MSALRREYERLPDSFFESSGCRYKRAYDSAIDPVLTGDPADT
jgi:hypothetical protein